MSTYYLLFSMNTISMKLKLAMEINIEQNTLHVLHVINTHTISTYLLKYHDLIFMFINTFSITISSNFSSFWVFFALTKMHEKSLHLFHLHINVIIQRKLDGCKGNTAKA